MANSYKCGKIIITADQGSSAYRKEYFLLTKQNRKDKYAQQTEEEALAFKEFFLEYEQNLSLLKIKYTVIQVPCVEADDIAAYLVKYKDKFKIGDIVLVSSDRDWDLLIQEGVMRFSYVTQQRGNFRKLGAITMIVPREQYACFKCLVGDKGDNVPGITGIGPKRAQQLLEEYGSAYNIYDSLPINSSYKHIQALNASEDLILRNYELMDLLTHCEDAIDFNYGREELERRMQ